MRVSSPTVRSSLIPFTAVACDSEAAMLNPAFVRYIGMELMISAARPVSRPRPSHGSLRASSVCFFRRRIIMVPVANRLSSGESGRKQIRPMPK